MTTASEQRSRSIQASRIDTRAVRGGEPDRHAYDAVTVPVVCAATYGFRDSRQIRDLFEGDIEREEYGRYGNPTVRAAETKLAALEHAADAVLFPSGMSAITTLLFSMLKPGDHVVLTSDCYRRTRQLVTDSLSRWGVDHSLVDGSDLAAVERAIAPGRTRLLLSEAPTNPYLRVIDVRGFAAIRSKFPRLKLVVDSTLGTPVNVRPIELGADLVVHSCTKYLGGHNDLLAGAICGSREMVEALRDARGLFGSMPDPHGAYLLVRGMKTLAVRMRQHNASGERVARFLSEHPAIERVYYPGLPSHPDHGVAAREFAGFGGMVSFLVRGDLQTTSRFIDGVGLATIGPSMGGVETLIEQPALMSFYGLSTEQRNALGIRDNLVRLSVGLEDAQDIVEDLETALRRAHEPGIAP
jgi:cystathionine gamma-synthase